MTLISDVSMDKWFDEGVGCCEKFSSEYLELGKEAH
jgi:hypothetical protein